MSELSEKRQILLEELNQVIADLRETYQHIPDPNVMIYEVWTAKDILAHLTFWHESFARNLRDLADGVKPSPLKGKLGDLNQAGVDAMKSCSLEVVMERLEKAHRTIQAHILNPIIMLIPYRIGTRDYTPEEHLEIVIDHIKRHRRDVVKICHS